MSNGAEINVQSVMNIRQPRPTLYYPSQATADPEAYDRLMHLELIHRKYPKENERLEHREYPDYINNYMETGQIHTSSRPKYNTEHVAHAQMPDYERRRHQEYPDYINDVMETGTIQGRRHNPEYPE